LIHLLTGVAPANLPQKDCRIQFADRVSLNPSLVSWIETLTEIAIEKRYSNARQALAELQSRQEQSASDKTAPIRKVSKPSGTRIKVNTSRDELLIYLPNDKISNPEISNIFACLGCLTWPLLSVML
ncbi:MAG TPA: serine/threonine protein kinase, partial [Cyanobacteria bacterium UBA12227]|nr:serine/threonine protein kinase [Cyanobacteria bacterium UBA12227]